MVNDVIVVGGGHSGLEAALAAARMGQKTLLVTQKLETIGVLSCNPAFGGPAKGGLLREIDALGGYAGFGADRAAVQCRVLGESKGPAARSTRNLVDRATYSQLAQEFAKNQPGLSIMAGEAEAVEASNGRVTGLVLTDGRHLTAGAVVLTGGTFWNGRIYHGLVGSSGGRIGEPPADHLKSSLVSLGHRLGRLSTNTAPRLQAETIDYYRLTEQPGEDRARPFSVLNHSPRNLVSCYLTWTNLQTHKIVSDNLKTSIIYADSPVSTGPRYCPSLEDKIVNYPDRQRHQLFLEPDGPGIVYPSGLTTGLDPEVQKAVINSIEGMEKTVIARPGYAIEYDFCDPRDLSPALESLLVKGLFMAGQVNGTSGYEEAASQGLWAGVGAALRASGRDPLYLGRHQALMGVMFDDLTVLGVTEPYRMFTSRAEWRLRLREDNADLRLSPLADQLGLLDAPRRELLETKTRSMARAMDLLRATKISLSQAQEIKETHHLPEKDVSLAEPMLLSDFLKRPPVRLVHLLKVLPELAELSPIAVLTLETEIKYAGYLSRQEDEIARLRRQENTGLAKDLDFRQVPGLSREAAEVLTERRPLTIGQAGRLCGVTPAALTALSIYVHKRLAAHL